MLTVPWRAFLSAMTCYGQAPHVATGVASARQTHCQPVKRNAGTIETKASGTASATEPMSLCGPSAPADGASVVWVSASF